MTVTSAWTAAPATSPVDALTPDGHVDRDDGLPRGVDPLDHASDVFARRILEADPEQRIDDHVRVAELAETVDLNDVAPALAEHPRADAAVAAVVAAAADHGDATLETLVDHVGDRRPRALHQLLHRAGVRRLGLPDLVGRQEREQRGHAAVTTTTAAASSRECVIDSSIVPAPTRSANAAVRRSDGRPALAGRGSRSRAR